MAFDPWIPEPTDRPLTAEELALATRNRGMPLEALRYDLTPTGLSTTTRAASPSTMRCGTTCCSPTR